MNEKYQKYVYAITPAFPNKYVSNEYKIIKLPISPASYPGHFTSYTLAKMTQALVGHMTP